MTAAVSAADINVKMKQKADALSDRFALSRHRSASSRLRSIFSRSSNNAAAFRFFFRDKAI